ncbi:hypothetical protein ACLKA7_014109 [Drosophila subpalustris]
MFPATLATLKHFSNLQLAYRELKSENREQSRNSRSIHACGQSTALRTSMPAPGCQIHCIHPVGMDTQPDDDGDGGSCREAAVHQECGASSRIVGSIRLFTSTM